MSVFTPLFFKSQKKNDGLLSDIRRPDDQVPTSGGPMPSDRRDDVFRPVHHPDRRSEDRRRNLYTVSGTQGASEARRAEEDTRRQEQQRAREQEDRERREEQSRESERQEREREEQAREREEQARERERRDREREEQAREREREAGDHGADAAGGDEDAGDSDTLLPEVQQAMRQEMSQTCYAASSCTLAARTGLHLTFLPDQRPAVQNLHRELRVVLGALVDRSLSRPRAELVIEALNDVTGMDMFDPLVQECAGEFLVTLIGRFHPTIRSSLAPRLGVMFFTNRLEGPLFVYSVYF